LAPLLGHLLEIGAGLSRLHHGLLGELGVVPGRLPEIAAVIGMRPFLGVAGASAAPAGHLLLVTVEPCLVGAADGPLDRDLAPDHRRGVPGRPAPLPKGFADPPGSGEGVVWGGLGLPHMLEAAVAEPLAEVAAVHRPA